MNTDTTARTPELETKSVGLKMHEMEIDTQIEDQVD